MKSRQTTETFVARGNSENTIEQSYNTVIIIVVSFFIIIVVVTTPIRAYTRKAVLHSFSWEDWLMCFASICLITTCGVCLGSLSLGILQNLEDIPRSDLLKLRSTNQFIVFVYYPTIAATKLSILLQMLRIFIPIVRTRSWWCMQAFILINMLFYAANIISDLIACLPRAKTKDQEFPGMCVIWTTSSVSIGIFNAISDLIMLIMPIFWITRLRLDTGRKIVACAVFTVGLLACTASTTRLAFSIKYMLSGDPNSYQFESVRLELCRASECAAGIVCGNLPSIPKFFRNLRRKQQKPVLIQVLDAPKQEKRFQGKVASSPDSLPDLVFLVEEHEISLP